MKILNLHNHPLTYEYKDDNNKNLYVIKSNEIKNDFSEKYLVSFKCQYCQEFYNDYKSFPEATIPNIKESLFLSKDVIAKYKPQTNIILFELVEFCNTKLIGTKNEIISYICKKYDELNDKYSKSQSKIINLDSTIKTKEEEIVKVKDNLQNEEKMKNDLESKISELQLQEKQEKEKLEKYLKEKENEIKNLKNDNKDLGKKNQELNTKLDNISIENNNNIKTVLTQLENEQQKKKDLEVKFSELQEQEKQKHIKNEELEKCLKSKDEELKVFQKNESFGLKFESDNKSGDYDIILDITSFQDLVNKGWPIKYNKKEGKAQYLKKKNEPTIIVGVIGNGNKGKSFFLEKLSGYDIPKGFNVKTEGLSIRYGTSQEHNIAILDSAGQETPLLKVANEKNENISEGNICSDNKEELNETPNINSSSKENGETKEVNDKNCDQKANENKLNKSMEKETSQKKEQLEDEDIEFEKYSRDKLITEFFLQKFIIWKSDLLILVVGNISLTEQKLLSRVKAEVESMDKNKQIYVIHNLKDYSTEEQVNDYIENTLKRLYKIEIEEILRQNISKDKDTDKKCINNYFNKYFVEKGKKVIHLIFVNEFSEKADFYNVPTIEFIQKEIEVIKTRNIFSIIDDCKKFFVKISEEIMEGNPKLENLETEEGEKYDKIVLKNLKGITLKKFVVDEMGYTLNNDSNTPKYSYYIDTEEKILYINIELPGGGSIEPRVEIVSGYYIFIFEGEKKGDIAIEEDKKKEIGKLIQKKNLRKSNKFKLEIKIPNSVMQIKLEDGEELSDAGDFVDNGKGVYSFKYKVLILNQKNEKAKKKKKIEL